MDYIDERELAFNLANRSAIRALPYDFVHERSWELYGRLQAEYHGDKREGLSRLSQDQADCPK
jgi:hypothetical protein